MKIHDMSRDMTSTNLMSYDVGTVAHPGQAETGFFVDSNEMLCLRSVLLGSSGRSPPTLLEFKM